MGPVHIFDMVLPYYSYTRRREAVMTSRTVPRTAFARILRWRAMTAYQLAKRRIRTHAHLNEVARGNAHLSDSARIAIAQALEVPPHLLVADGLSDNTLRRELSRAALAEARLPEALLEAVPIESAPLTAREWRRVASIVARCLRLVEHGLLRGTDL